MGTWLRRSAWAILLLALLSAGVRLALIATPMETGWEVVLTAWRDLPLAWIGREPTPISQQDPPDQADFWLREVDDVLAGNPETAELCMGAAWVLDAPGSAYRRRYFRIQDLGSGISFPRFDYDANEALCSQFDAKCQSRCLALVARATALDPEDVRCWRMRALLLFSDEGDPRGADWRDVLEECSQHDPENALYDYLATRALWGKSFDVEWVDSDYGDSVARVKILDQEHLDEGIRRFEAGQHKSFLEVGETGYPAIAVFLSKSHLSKTAQAEVAVQRFVADRQVMLVSRLLRQLGDQADDARSHGDKAELIAMRRRQCRLFEQSVTPAGMSAMRCNELFSPFLLYALNELPELADSNPDLIHKDVADQLVAQAKAFRTEALVFGKGVGELNRPREEQKFSAINTSIVALNAMIVTAILFLSAGASFLVARLLDRRISEDRRLGFLRHALAWVLGIGLSITLFGLMPAEIVSRKVQTIIAITFAWGFVLAIVGFAAWKATWIGRHRRFQYRILTLLGCMVAVAVFAGIWPVLAATASRVRDLSAEFHVPAKGWSGIDAEILKLAPEFSSGGWRWALAQWSAYHGPCLAASFALVLVGLWYLRRRAKQAGEKIFRYWTVRERSRWSGLFRCLATSSITTGACALLIYLWLIPTTLRVSEAEFQYRMRYCRNPAYHIAQIDRACAAVRACEEDMDAIHAEVEASFTRVPE